MWYYLTLFFVAFLAGFLTMWFSFDDLGTQIVFFESEEELQQMHWDGLRKGPQ
tara:strand:- start:59 stop:217 length:159 start_codon:yes stop_codon:yes gene_type:complete